MKTLIVRVEESIVEEVLDFFHSLPHEQIRIIEFPEAASSRIEDVTAEEQSEIAALLKDEDTGVFELRRAISI